MTLHLGDCLAWLGTLEAESVDAIVTDPPYGLGFMGKAWDALPPGREWAEACFRVLKPGGHLVAFGGTRTAHRLTVAVEDAGFEIRDSIGWVYYSGFPKSLDVARSLDAAAGRRGVSHYTGPNHRNAVYGAGMGGGATTAPYEPATPAAVEWSGFGTALKPAIEPAVLARKPLAGTVAGNVLQFRTGALNIDGCRLAPGDPAWVGPDDGPAEVTQGVNSRRSSFAVASVAQAYVRPDAGRWPANLYYCPKASRAERERGTDGLPARSGADAVDRKEGSAGTRNPRAGAGRTASEVRNHHPTVKPVRLMRWLCRLVTPPGGLVVDPFTGSGTTGIAATLEGFRFAGAERESEYHAITAARMAHAARWPASWADTAPGFVGEADDSVERVERLGQVALFGGAR